jgi:hypothetical protein
MRCVDSATRCARRVDAKAKHVRTQEREQCHSPPPKLQQISVAKPQETINARTVGLAGGLLEGAPRGR